MANLSRSRRLFQPGDKYHYVIDNRPLEDIWHAIDDVNNEQNAITNEVRVARGSSQTLGARLDRFSHPDGRIKIAGLNDPFDYNDPAVNDKTKEVNSDTVVNYDGQDMPGVRDVYMQSISAHYDTTDHVRMKTAERNKLAGIENRATRTRVRVDDNAEAFSSGEINFRSGQGIELQQLGQALYVHSLLPVDLLHKHVFGERPKPYPPTVRDARTGRQSAVEVDGTVRTFIVEDSYGPGSMQVYVNGNRIDPVRISEDDPEAGIFSFQQWVTDLPDETNNDSIRVDYIVQFGLSSSIATPTFTAYETFQGYGQDLAGAVQSTWKLTSPALMQSSLHQLFINGQHAKMRPYPFDPTDTEVYDWQLGNTSGRVDGQTIKRDTTGNLISEYVIWINPYVDIKPEDEISIYYQS